MTCLSPKLSLCQLSSQYDAGYLGYLMELPWVDPRDPNYDSDREEAAEVGPGVGGHKTIKLNTLVSALANELSMDHKPSHREMTSQLISEL